MPSQNQRHFYLLPPRDFRIEYEINQWMHTDQAVDQPRAMQQWQSLRQTYEELGATVEVVELEQPRPDHVFLGDSIFLYGEQAVASRFRYAERAAEVKPIVEEFKGRGYTVHQPPESLHFEGNGDNVLWNGHVLAGYGPRSDRAAHAFLEETLGLPVVPLEVMAPHFHVDTTVCPLNDKVLAYVPSGLSPESVERLQALKVDLIEIGSEDALRLAGNCITIQDHVVMSTERANGFVKALEHTGFTPLPLDLSEFAKSGGGAKCLTLEAYPVSS